MSSSSSSSSSTSSTISSKVVLVTGGNKGIGYAIIEDLLGRSGSGYHILLGARDAKNGEAAVKALQQSKKNINNLSTVEFISLDIDNQKSVESAAAEVKKKYSSLDILINNAGIVSKEQSRVTYEGARSTIDTNYYGTLRVLRAFTPLLKEGSRIVNVSSTMGQYALQAMSEENRQRFLSEDLTIEGLHKLMEEFISAVKDGSHVRKGWPNTAPLDYGVSKSGLTMLSRLWTKEINNKLNDVIVSAVCPGWVKTEMGGPNALLTIDQGVITPIHCALLTKGSPNGVFWANEKVQPFA